MRVQILTKHQNYLVGAQSQHVISKFVKHTSRMPTLIIKRGDTTNCADDINLRLNNYDIKNLYKTIMMDTYASLELIKDPPNNNLLENPYIMSLDEFMMFPFDKNIGIIMPQRVLYETYNSVMFQATIIDNNISI